LLKNKNNKMITQQDFQKNFAPYETPAELGALLDFQNLKAEWYSGRFELVATRDRKELSSYNEAAAFNNDLLLIAQTSSSGTQIFFWICNAAKPLNEQPIVIFGDEGGYDVLFENVKDMLYYLTYNAAIYNANELAFKDNSYKENTRVAEYADWLLNKYSLPVITDVEAEAISVEARRKYADLFSEWMKKFVE
jgi:hypothetical protein